MAIDKHALFKSTMALWPMTIALSEPDATHKIYRANEEAHPVEDDWAQVAMWSYHQAIGELEKHAALDGTTVIYPREIKFGEFEKWIRFNLSGDDCWLAERAEWESAS